MHCDDDEQGTSSSVNIMHSSEPVLSQIQKSQKNMQSSSEEKVQQSSVDRDKGKKKENLRRSISSGSQVVESRDIIKYPSESKQTMKRSAVSENELLQSSTKHVKISKKENLWSSFTSQVPCEATTSIINNCAKQNSHSGKNSPKKPYSLVPISLEPNSMYYSELMSNDVVSPSVKTGNSNNCYYELIKKIVEMNPKWLYQKEKMKIPPPSVTSGAGQLPLSFDSYDTYVNSFLQMILLEVWDTMCLTSEPYLKSKSENKFYFSVISALYVHRLMKLKCESVVNNDKSFSPHNNSLVILDLKEENSSCLPTFGLITNVNTQPLDIEFMKAHKWECLPKEGIQKAKVLKYDVYVKSRKIALAKGCVMTGNHICNLKDKMNLADALNSLKHSPMVNCILAPDWANCSVKCNISHSNDYMSIQNDISHSVLNEMTLPDEEKKIILLEGPPGSGKTEIIARVCQKLIENASKTFKILVAAPSHFAVDNIANQMIELNQRLGSEEIKFIRTGEKSFIDREHLKYSLCEKLENSRKKIDLEKERIHKEISNYQKMSPKGRQGIENEISKLKLELKTTKWDELHEKCVILKDTNIVLTTFSDCFNLYETKMNFSCCIFDEANQATELDTLFPFMLKSTKYFIIGDTKQLPPNVKSELAIKYGFQRSILERFQAYFMNKCKKSPAIQLKMQFRMHGDISIFPMRTFYFEDYSPPQYSYSFKKWFLEPYIVLDDISTYSSNDKTGCSIITSLCSSIIKHDPVCSTAIIVPSDLQKQLYMSALALRFPTIKVCTTDNIQGQEKSICILSCYKGSTANETYNKLFSCKRTLNVALTRASHCLIICGPLLRLERLPCLNALIKDAKARKCYIPFSHEDNIFKIFQEKILKN